MTYAFMYGTVLAIGLIMPLGIQNIFIFNQGASQKHFMQAMPSVITASICDMLLITCAVLGVSVVVMAISWLKLLLFIVGLFFLLYMGLVTWHAQPGISVHAGEKPLSAKRQILFTLSVSLLNPHALIDSIGVLGTNSLRFVGYEKFAFTSGCILVSSLWFIFLSIAGHFCHRLDSSGKILMVMNKVSAIIIWIVALNIGFKILQGG